MKNRTDRILLRIFIVSLVVYGVLLCAYAAFAWAQGLRYSLFSLHLWLVRNFHAVPFFALQLLLCRRSATGAKYLAVQLTALMLGLLLLSYIGYLTVRGWNILGFMIALSLSIARWWAVCWPGRCMACSACWEGANIPPRPGNDGKFP